MYLPVRVSFAFKCASCSKMNHLDTLWREATYVLLDSYYSGSYSVVLGDDVLPIKASKNDNSSKPSYSVSSGHTYFI